MRCRVLGHEPDCLEVDVHDEIPGRLVEPLDRCVIGDLRIDDTGVVHDTVEAAHEAHRPFDERLNLGGAAKISLNEGCLHSG